MTFNSNISTERQRGDTMAILVPLLFTFTLFSALNAAALPPLKCNVTKLNDNSTRYQISEKPRFTDCPTSWEDKNNTVIVDLKSNYDKSIVKTVQNDSVELLVCKDFLLYKTNCWKEYEGDQEATCEVNCTLLMMEDSVPLEDGFPVWGIVVVTLGIIFGIIFFILGKIFLKRVCRGSVFQNNHSSRTNRTSSQSLTQSDAGAIMDNVINEKVSTDASQFRPERSDPEDPEDVELTPLSVCHREPRSA